MIGWIVKPIGNEENKIEVYFIKANKGLPVEIIYNQINLKNKIYSDASSLSTIQSIQNYETLELKQTAILSKKEKFSLISLTGNQLSRESEGLRSGVNKKASQCWDCPTLPNVIVYGKKKRKPLFVNMGSFDPDTYDVDVVYVPVNDQGGDGGGSGGGSGDLEGGGGGDGEEHYEDLEMSQFTVYDVVKGVNLYTNDYYPGKDIGFPWKWWANAFTPQQQQAIEQVKQEFEEEPPTTSSCKGTQRFPGRSSYSGTAEHTIIQFDYMNQNPLTAEREYSIPNSSLLGNTGYADLVNKLTREIFEIKPANNQTEIINGRAEVGRYVEKACVHCGGGFKKGQNYPQRIFPYPGRPDKNMRVTLREDGLIVYEEISKTSQPVPVPVPQSVSEKLKKFFKNLVEYPDMAEEQMAYFLKQNPEIKNYLLYAGVGLIIATIIEDFATLGIGITDDIPTILLAMKLIRLARILP